MATPAPKNSTSRLIDVALIALIVFVLTQAATRYFSPKQEEITPVGGLTLQSTAASYRQGVTPILTVENRTKNAITLKTRCPMPPVDVFAVQGSGTLKPLTTTETAVPCPLQPALIANGKTEINLGAWKYSLFGEVGTYEVRLPSQGLNKDVQSGAVLSARFSVYEPGALAKLFRTFISKPFFNFLIFTASILPDHNLGVGIILLTLLVKLLLFYPTHKSLEGQKKMQLLQPKLEAVKREHKDDPKKMQEETMRLWKEHGVNPLQSCLPILLQFPILIGLFYVIRDGADLTLSRHLIYPFYQNIPWNFNTQFLGLDLTKPSFIFPPLLVLLQFLQMKLSFLIAKKKSGKQEKEPTEQDKAQQIQQQMMTYLMPLLIGFFAFKFPSAVSLYWGVSTLFAIGQQMIVSREHLSVRG